VANVSNEADFFIAEFTVLTARRAAAATASFLDATHAWVWGDESRVLGMRDEGSAIRVQG